MTHATLLDEIRAAYRTHRLVPARKTFFFEAGGVAYACPLVALAIHRGAVGRSDPGLALDGAANPVLGWAAGEFGEPWAWGFLDGFDGRPAALADPNYLDGYRQGALAAQETLAGGSAPGTCTARPKRRRGNPHVLRPATGSVLGVRDCGPLVLLYVATDEGEVLPVHLDRWSFRWLPGWEGRGLVGSRIEYAGGRIVSLDEDGLK